MRSLAFELVSSSALQHDEARIALDIELLAEWCRRFRRAVDRCHVHELGVGLGKGSPDGLELLAMTAPGCIEHDKPGLISDRLVCFAVDNLSVEDLHVELDRTTGREGLVLHFLYLLLYFFGKILTVTASWHNFSSHARQLIWYLGHLHVVRNEKYVTILVFESVNRNNNAVERFGRRIGVRIHIHPHSGGSDRIHLGLLLERNVLAR